MSYEILIKPSGHKFIAESHESLLEAALRSGMNMTYSCNSGSCGECKAKILSGEISTLRHSDYMLSEKEKLDETVLLCCVTAQSKLIVEASEAIGAEDIPIQQVKVKVAKIERLNHSVLILHLRTPRSKTLRFLAGQKIKIKISDFPEFELPIASCPCNGMVLQFHLQRDGILPVVDYIFDELRVSETIKITGPQGGFTLDEESQRPMVLVAEGTGLAPMKSLIEHAIALDLTQSIYLFWLVEESQSHYLSNYCRSWELALDCFVFIPLTYAEQSNGNQVYNHTVNDTLARCPIETEIDLYISGSQDMVSAFSRIFIERGTPNERIRSTTVS